MTKTQTMSGNGKMLLTVEYGVCSIPALSGDILLPVGKLARLYSLPRLHFLFIKPPPVYPAQYYLISEGANQCLRGICFWFGGICMAKCYFLARENVLTLVI